MFYFRYQTAPGRAGLLERVPTAGELKELLRMRASGSRTRTFYVDPIGPAMREMWKPGQEPTERFPAAPAGASLALVWEADQAPAPGACPHQVWIQDAHDEIICMDWQTFTSDWPANPLHELPERQRRAFEEATSLTAPGVLGVVQWLANEILKDSWDNYMITPLVRAWHLAASATYDQVAQLIEIEKDEPGQGATPQQILALVQVGDSCMASTGHPVNLLSLMNHLATLRAGEEGES